MSTKTKIYLINVGLTMQILTLLHWTFQLFWPSDSTPFFRLFIAGIIAKFNPIYHPTENNQN